MLVIRSKHLFRPSIILIATATVIFTGTAVFNYVEATRTQHAVILPEQVAVRSGFSDTATQQHAGCGGGCDSSGCGCDDGGCC